MTKPTSQSSQVQHQVKNSSVCCDTLGSKIKVVFSFSNIILCVFFNNI